VGSCPAGHRGRKGPARPRQSTWTRRWSPRTHLRLPYVPVRRLPEDRPQHAPTGAVRPCARHVPLRPGLRMVVTGWIHPRQETGGMGR
jgi:hypothetical protein